MRSSRNSTSRATCGRRRTSVPSGRSSRPRSACHRQTWRRAPSATRPAASSWGTDSRSYAAAARERCRRAATVANGWSPRGRVRCPSASKVSCPRPRPISCSWWRGYPGAVRRGNASPLPTAGLRSPRQKLLQRGRASQPFCHSDLKHQCLPCQFSLLLCFASGGLLGCLQRIERGRTGESAALLRRLLRFVDQHVSIFMSRDRAFDDQQVVILVDRQDAQVADGLGVDAHVSRHAHALEDTRRERRCADGALHLEHVSVGCGAATELVAFDYTREAASLAGAGDIDELFVLEDVDQNFVADFCAVRFSGSFVTLLAGFGFDSDFADELHRRQIVLAEVTLH